MIATFIALFALQGPSAIETKLKDPDNGPSRLTVLQPVDRLASPKLSPRTFGDPPIHWEFDWVTAGYVRNPQTKEERMDIRFQVYSQQRKNERDPALPLTQMLLRLWDFNRRRLAYDHNPTYADQLVDVYLCWGGTPGGEQRFDIDEQMKDRFGKPRHVNNIYIYDLASFEEPIEKAREIAHEYGHAILPPVGGFAEPEDWGNGYLGEKLYLTWIRDEMKLGRYGTYDSMGADLPALNKWISTNVDPLVLDAATKGPDAKLLSSTGQAAMDAYTGLAMYIYETMPPGVFARSLKLNGTMKAKDYPDAIVTAAAEPEEIFLRIPEGLKDRAIWVPVGKGKVFGAEVLKQQGDWAQIRPGLGQVRLQVKAAL